MPALGRIERENMAHSHRFHRLALTFAMMVGVIGLVVIARDAVILRLWNVKYGDLPIVLAGALIGLVEVAVVCCAAYGPGTTRKFSRGNCISESGGCDAAPSIVLGARLRWPALALLQLIYNFSQIFKPLTILCTKAVLDRF